MNANELADELDYCYGKEYPCPVSKEAAAMLRQQQAEIEALKAAKIRAYNNGVEDGRKPDTNNKPVAWIGETLMGRQYINGQKDELPVGTALYTHPAELTDEEIIEIGLLTTDPRFSHIESPLLLEFARAILRKASEK